MAKMTTKSDTPIWRGRKLRSVWGDGREKWSLRVNSELEIEVLRTGASGAEYSAEIVLGPFSWGVEARTPDRALRKLDASARAFAKAIAILGAEP